MGHLLDLPEMAPPERPGSADRVSVVDHDPDGPVWVRVVGGGADGRVEDLWSEIEKALQDAAGCMVVVNLAEATGFDIDAIEMLVLVARTVRRWHVDLCVVVRPMSAMNDDLRAYSLHRLIPIYGSDQAARGAMEDDQTYGAAPTLIESYQSALTPAAIQAVQH